MKADNIEMFSIAIEQIEADHGMPFPLYLYLVKNNRFIPIRHEGDPLGKFKKNLTEASLNELYIPDKYYDICRDLIEPENEKSEEANLVAEVFEDDGLTPEVKSEILSALSQDVLQALSQISDRGDDAKKDGLERCREIADEILTVASQYSSIYDEALSMRGTQEEIEHSIVVGSIAVMFAMATGVNDEIILADLILAALFHDIGVVYLSEEVRKKSQFERDGKEQAEYRTHVAKSVEQLHKADKDFPKNILKYVEQHHEHYDGSGYPKGLEGDEIDELSQILALADWFDDLQVGQITGECMSPQEAFDTIYEISMDEDQPSWIKPELIERIFQFMVDQKEELEAMAHDSEQKAREMLAKEA